MIAEAVAGKVGMAVLGSWEKNLLDLLLHVVKPPKKNIWDGFLRPIFTVFSYVCEYWGMMKIIGFTTFMILRGCTTHYIGDYENP